MKLQGRDPPQVIEIYSKCNFIGKFRLIVNKNVVFLFFSYNVYDKNFHYFNFLKFAKSEVGPSFRFHKTYLARS